jgi:hypothetical protein
MNTSLRFTPRFWTEMMLYWGKGGQPIALAVRRLTGNLGTGTHFSDNRVYQGLQLFDGRFTPGFGVQLVEPWLQFP